MRPVRGGYGWFWLVQVAAVVETALLFAAGVILRDAEALGLAFVVLLTLGWILFRPGRIVPVLVRGLVFADVAFWMLPAAVTNALSHEPPLSTIVPGILSTTAIIGLAATLASCFPVATWRPEDESRAWCRRWAWCRLPASRATPPQPGRRTVELAPATS